MNNKKSQEAARKIVKTGLHEAFIAFKRGGEVDIGEASLAILNALATEDFVMFQDKELQEAFSPSHYTQGEAQPIDLITANGMGLDFCLGNIIKYACRAKHKGQMAADLRKIIVYAYFAAIVADKEAT